MNITHRTIVRRTALGGAAAAFLALGSTGAASAASDTGSTDGSVAVNSEISLSALVGDFTLTGLPTDDVEQIGAVTFTVGTNNLAGYGVTVQAAAATMAPETPGNADSIPISALSVRETGATAYTPVSATTATSVHTQDGRSAETGDDLSNDYSVTIPFVNQDAYTATLDYIATTL